jgi:3-dehydroquinate synthase class II
MGYCLRYKGRDFKLIGTITVGRGASCGLSLDEDALVSRRHATVTLLGEKVIVEDLRSRNGVVVNGTKIDGKADVRPGDTISIGSQDLILVVNEESDDDNEFLDGHTVTVEGKPADAPASQMARPVDFVTIGGREYAVIPKDEYLKNFAVKATIDAAEARGGKKSSRRR